MIAIVCLAVGAAGARLGVLPPMIGFGLFFVGGLLGLVALLWGLTAKVRKKSRGGAIAAIVGGVPFLVVAVSALVMRGNTGPGINDITTDTNDPPTFSEASGHGDYPADFIEKSAKAYPAVKPLVLELEPGAAIALATTVAGERGWTITDTRDDGFEAYEESSLFRFRDDFVVRIKAGSTTGSVVNMRSASRDGKADFGVNATRIESFLGDVSKRANK